jgi:hypothetical protein
LQHAKLSFAAVPNPDGFFMPCSFNVFNALAYASHILFHLLKRIALLPSAVDVSECGNVFIPVEAGLGCD